VLVTFPNGETATVFGFKNSMQAATWIRTESVVWLHEKRKARQ
jgi:hypothetical protein